MSAAEILLAAQLEQAGIPFRREFRFAEILTPPRKWRADFAIGSGMYDLLIEVQGGTWSLGRHNRPSSIAKDYEKAAAAAILGYRVIYATTEQVMDGTCLRWIKEALHQEENAA